MISGIGSKTQIHARHILFKISTFYNISNFKFLFTHKHLGHPILKTPGEGQLQVSIERLALSQTSPPSRPPRTVDRIHQYLPPVRDTTSGLLPHLSGQVGNTASAGSSPFPHSRGQLRTTRMMPHQVKGTYKIILFVKFEVTLPFNILRDVL